MVNIKAIKKVQILTYLQSLIDRLSKDEITLEWTIEVVNGIGELPPTDGLVEHAVTGYQLVKLELRIVSAVIEAEFRQQYDANLIAGGNPYMARKQSSEIPWL